MQLTPCHNQDLSYEVRYEDQLVISPSPLGLNVDNQWLGKDVTFKPATNTTQEGIKTYVVQRQGQTMFHVELQEFDDGVCLEAGDNMNTKELDNNYVSHAYGRFNVELSHGKGSTLYDENGKEYIDLGSGIGVTAFGIADRKSPKSKRKRSAGGG